MITWTVWFRPCREWPSGDSEGIALSATSSEKTPLPHENGPPPLGGEFEFFLLGGRGREEFEPLS